ncbi:MAG: hypothetical protein WD342_12815 [Verrucomicrobiales bacterium]
MAARDEGYYLKEIIGTAIWIAVLVFVFRDGGLEQCRRAVSLPDAATVESAEDR